MNRLFRIFLLAFIPSMFIASPSFGQEENQTLEIAEDKADAKEEAAAEKPASTDFVVRMKNNKFLRGVPVDLAFIDVYILGTKVAVPVDQIVGVRFAQGPNEKGTVALKNGEMLSGRIDPPKIILAVDWGQATINSDFVNSLVRDATMQWQMRNAPNGPQWYLAPRPMGSSAIFDYSSQFVANPTPETNRIEPVAAPATTRKAVSKNIRAAYSAPISDTTSLTAFPQVNQSEFAWIW